MQYSFPLADYLSGHVFQFFLVFTRIGAAMMLFPGVGESFVSPRVRLMLSLTISFLMFQPMIGSLPRPPDHIADMTLLIAKEAFVGVFFGSILRLFMGAIETTGSLIAVQTGLSNAMILNPAMAMQSPLPGAFLGTAALTLVFITGLDHQMLRGLMETYKLFPVGGELPSGDLVREYISLITKSFQIGVELAAPFLIAGLLLFTTVSFMQRLMPQVQLFLITLPVEIWGGMALFAAAIGLILALWLSYMESSLAELLLSR